MCSCPLLSADFFHRFGRGVIAMKVMSPLTVHPPAAPAAV